jgi:hypothetical protein
MEMLVFLQVCVLQFTWWWRQWEMEALGHFLSNVQTGENRKDCLPKFLPAFSYPGLAMWGGQEPPSDCSHQPSTGPLWVPLTGQALCQCLGLGNAEQAVFSPSQVQKALRPKSLCAEQPCIPRSPKQCTLAGRSLDTE